MKIGKDVVIGVGIALLAWYYASENKKAAQKKSVEGARKKTKYRIVGDVRVGDSVGKTLHVSGGTQMFDTGDLSHETGRTKADGDPRIVDESPTGYKVADGYWIAKKDAIVNSTAPAKSDASSSSSDSGSSGGKKGSGKKKSGGGDADAASATQAAASATPDASSDASKSQSASSDDFGPGF